MRGRFFFFINIILFAMTLVTDGVELRDDDDLDFSKTTTSHHNILLPLSSGMEFKAKSHHHRKMLRLSPYPVETGKVEPERIGEYCSISDLVLNQAPTEPMPNGIPGYTVEITNQCMSGCKISRIHVTCGWFSSTNLINPRVFKRIHYDDCLVNNGKPLPHGATISFHYANSFPYPLSVSFVTCS